MGNSVSYRIYRGLKNSYVNSMIIGCFSKLFSNLFNILVNSKIFTILSSHKATEIFRISLIWRVLCKVNALATKWFDKDFIKNTVSNSFFVCLIIDVVDSKKKDAINGLYLIPILMLVVNMGIKIATQSFSIVGNRYLLGILFILIALYYLQLDYWVIIRNSKIFRVCYEIFYDEPLDNDI